jgi:hypothetical protein
MQYASPRAGPRRGARREGARVPYGTSHEDPEEDG